MEDSSSSSGCGETECLAEFAASTSQMNLLVMDYLLNEGYKEAAEKFAVEAGLEQTECGEDIRDCCMEQRIEIRHNIQHGSVSEAIGQINELCPELLDDNRYLHFHLLQQHLIELIRSGCTEEALDFAQEQLAEKGEELPRCLPEIERTLALLVFDKPETSPFADLMQMSHRQQVADEVNSAILSVLGCASGPRMETLVQTVLWSQDQLDKKRVAYTRMTDLGSAQIDEPKPKKGMYALERERLR